MTYGVPNIRMFVKIPCVLTVLYCFWEILKMYTKWSSHGEGCLFWVNTLRLRQNGRLFADNMFTWIFLNENAWISLEISLNCVPKGWIDNIPALVQIMAWRRPGDKPLSKPMIFSLPTHICVTRPQWVNSLMYFLWAPLLCYVQCPFV